MELRQSTKLMEDQGGENKTRNNKFDFFNKSENLIW